MTAIKTFRPSSNYEFKQRVLVQPATHSESPVQLKQLGLVDTEGNLQSQLNDDGSLIWDLATGTNKIVQINKDLNLTLLNFTPLMSPFLEITSTGAGGYRVKVFMDGKTIRHGGGANGNLLDSDISLRALLGLRLAGDKITYSIDTQIVNQA